MTPSPIVKDSALCKVLDTVNNKLGKTYNSILITKYRDKNVGLGWHKDNEAEIDSSVPISTLSIGASRRFLISDSKEAKSRTQLFEKCLVENSVLTMQPSLQISHVHRVAEGRSSIPSECGVRFSLTFRRLKDSTSSANPTPATSASSSQNSVPASTTTSDHNNCVNTLVFGSSLTRGLDEKLLSKRGKTFKVFTKGGARMEDIIKMIDEAVLDKDICTSCISSIFIVAGGNDVENIRSLSGVEKLKASYKKLVQGINVKFPAVRINILSLIPRRCFDYMHLQRIFLINDFLVSLCASNRNCFLIRMFTKFLLKKNLYFSKNEVYLNDKLYRADRLHFSAIGNSVIAKTLIAVANTPYT